MDILDRPSQIEGFRLLQLRGQLKLEMVGLKTRGRSAYSRIKEEFNIKGSRQSVLDQFQQIVKAHMQAYKGRSNV